MKIIEVETCIACPFYSGNAMRDGKYYHKCRIQKDWKEKEYYDLFMNCPLSDKETKPNE